MGCGVSKIFTETRSYNENILTILDVYFEAMAQWPRDKRGGLGPPWKGDKFPEKGDTDSATQTGCCLCDTMLLTVVESDMEIGLDNACQRVRFKTEWIFKASGARIETEVIFCSTGPESCEVTATITGGAGHFHIYHMQCGVENVIKKHGGRCTEAANTKLGYLLRSYPPELPQMLADQLQNKIVGKQIGTNEWKRISKQGGYSTINSASNIVGGSSETDPASNIVFDYVVTAPSAAPYGTEVTVGSSGGYDPNFGANL